MAHHVQSEPDIDQRDTDVASAIESYGDDRQTAMRVLLVD